jgi:hypothetical protein
MPNLNDKIEGFVVGDDFQVKRTVSRLPDGQTVTKAILSVKKRLDQDMTDALSIIRKTITTTLSPDGQITNPGSGAYPDRVATVLFNFDGADTDDWRGHTMYYFDIVVFLSGGTDQTPIVGRMTGRQGPTNKLTP